MAGGGVEDVYGEDRATEEQLITPWSFSVASGHQLLRDPRHNKGLAFSEAERDAHYLRGLLPPAIVSQEHQEKKIMHNLRSYTVPLHRYIAMMDLQERNERLFYKLLIDNVEELLPVVYTPVVGEACQKYGSIYRRPQGLYISLKDKGKVLEVLKNWPERSIQVIVVTDGERILGLGDLGCQGMGIPVGKLSLYTALGGVRPSACLPITIDVGTNNETLLNDEYYIGLRQRRATGEEYHELLQEFMNAVKQNYGEKVLVQFEDFANHNAFDLLAKYSKSHLVFNDDIQGTASVVLAGLLAALRMIGGGLVDQTYLFLGAGEAGTGIAELIALEMSKHTELPVDDCRKKIWLVDSKGLLVESRKESLQHFKKPFAHEHEELKTLLEAVQSIKPTVLIGTSGVGKTFTQEVIEAMASFNEVSLSHLFLDSSCRGAKQRPCEKCRNPSSSRCRTRRRTRSARPRRPTPGARARRCSRAAARSTPWSTRGRRSCPGSPTTPTCSPASASASSSPAPSASTTTCSSPPRRRWRRRRPRRTSTRGLSSRPSPTSARSRPASPPRWPPRPTTWVWPAGCRGRTTW
uniref:Malic enzyme n=1 Tax=Aegilops tauschii subsp. strangulata TaxID=200361 RepID=A0A452Y5R0_AEGTS